MAGTYSELTQLFNQNIKTNGNQEITGAILNSILNEISSSFINLINLAASYGASYNKGSNTFSFNGLTNITWNEMMLIINEGKKVLESGVYTSSLIRTNIATSNRTGNSTVNFQTIYINCPNIEIIDPGGSMYCAELFRSFMNCPKLKSIGSTIYLANGNCNLSMYWPNGSFTFDECPELSSVQISGLQERLSLRDCSKISYSSLEYLVENLKNTAPIEVIVHPTTYSYLTGTAQPTAEVGGTSAQWKQLVTDASGKQCSFVEDTTRNS